jgi:hypothetical protein
MGGHFSRSSRQPARTRKGDGDVDQAEVAVSEAGARADTEIDSFIERRHHQRESGAEDPFGNVMVEDRSVLDEEWLALRREHERAQQQTRLQEWRAHHLTMARNLSRSMAAMVRHHLHEAQRLDRKG